MRRGSVKKRRKNSTLSKVSGDSKKPLLTMQFSTMLRKMKQKKREQLKIKTDEEEEYEKQVEENLNSRQAKLENEKHLIKLYESNYSSLFDSIKKEYNNKIKI